MPDYDVTKTNTQLGTYTLAGIFSRIVLAALDGLKATSAEGLDAATAAIERELIKLVNITSGGKRRLERVDE